MNSEEYNIISSIAKPHKVGKSQYAVLPKGYKIQDLSEFLDNPPKAKGTANFFNLESFIDYVKKYKNHSSITFCGFFTIKCIFDYHWYDGETLNAGNCQFTATYFNPVAFLMRDDPKLDELPNRHHKI
jgi:uncharacterized protein YfdQ (DUF2303 family)